MPIGFTDDPPAPSVPQTDVGGFPSPAGGGGFFGVPSTAGSFGAPGSLSSPFRRLSVLRGLRGMGENIPLVLRQQGAGLGFGSGGGFNPTPGVPAGGFGTFNGNSLPSAEGERVNMFGRRPGVGRNGPPVPPGPGGGPPAPPGGGGGTGGGGVGGPDTSGGGQGGQVGPILGRPGGGATGGGGPPGGAPGGDWIPGDPMTDPNGEPIRYNRPPRPGAGGGTSYPGVVGGGFPSFSGRGHAFGIPSGGDNLLPGRRFKSGFPGVQGYAGGGIAGIDPASHPMPSDSVDASLTPGEMVMNTGVTSNPLLLSILTLLNVLGAHHMEANMAGEPCPHCGGMKGDNADEDGDGYGCGGRVGYASGGVAGWANAFMGRNNWRGPSAAPATPTGGFQWTRDSNGNVSNYDPSNPWGSLSNSTNPSAYGTGTRLLGQAGSMGVFDPRGNQAAINSQIEAAQGTKDDLVRRNMTAADLSGLDPAQRAVARLQTLRETGRGVQDISAGIRADAANRADDFYRNLFGNYTGADINYILNEQQGRQNRITNSSASAGGQKHFWGNLAGNTLGGAIQGAASGGAGGPKP